MTSFTKLLFERLAGAHERAAFACEHETLTDYLVRYAGQDERGELASCYVAVPPESKRVVGYYTLSAHAILAEELSDQQQRGLPRYDRFPAFLIGRLARDISVKDRGVGRMLLLDAINRLVATEAAGRMIVVDPIDQKAAAFYGRFGFMPLGRATARLFLPMKVARKLVL